MTAIVRAWWPPAATRCQCCPRQATWFRDGARWCATHVPDWVRS